MNQKHLIFILFLMLLVLLGCQKQEKGISDEELFGLNSPTGGAVALDLSSYGLPAYYTITDLCKAAIVTSCQETSGVISFQSSVLGSGSRVDLCFDSSVVYNYKCLKSGSNYYLERCLVICSNRLSCLNGGCR